MKMKFGSLRSFGCAIATAGCLALVGTAAELALFQDAVTAAGGTCTISGGDDGQQYASGFGPGKAFDKVQYSTDHNDRWLGDTTKNTFLSIAAPAALFADRNVVLFSYSLRRCSIGDMHLNRAPKSWQILGRNSDDEEWTVIDAVTGYDGWAGTYDTKTAAKSEDCVRTFRVPNNAASFVQYKYVPLEVLKDTAGQWNTGLMELEFHVLLSPKRAEVLFQDAVATAGGFCTLAGGDDGQQYASGFGPGKAFDKVQYSTDHNDRWLGDTTKGTYLSIAASVSVFAGWDVVLSSYTLYRCSVSGYNLNRAPKSWQILGRNSNDDEWTVIDAVTDYDGWAGTYDTGDAAKLEDCVRTFDLPENAASFVQYKYVPLAAMKGGAGQWDTGLMELELYVTLPKGELFQNAVAAAGGACTIAGGVAEQQYPSDFGPEKAFDGITYSKNGTYNTFRWLGDTTKNTFLSIAAPASLFAGKNVVLSSYALHRCSVSSYHLNRAPKSWQILGRNSDDEEWTVIHTVSGYDGWAGTYDTDKAATERDCLRIFAVPNNETSYVQYKYVPLEAMKGGAGQWDTGLMELELFVDVSDVVSGEDKLVIASDLNAAGNPDPACGSVNVAPGASRTCRAGGRPDFRDGRCYTCNGYSLETSDDGGQTWSAPEYHRGAGDEYVFTNEGVLTRLTWLWDVTAHKLTVTADLGRETFAYAPEADFVDLDGCRYYKPGSTVTLTPIGAVEPTVSTFRAWENPPEGSTQSGDALVLTMPDALLSVNASFARHWKFVPKAESGLVADTIFDGNWQIYVDAHSGTIDGVTKPYQTSAPSGRGNAVVAGSGRLDFTTLNADLAAQGIEKPLKHIRGKSFSDCETLTELVIPADIPSLYGSAFLNCTHLTSATLCPNLLLWDSESGTGAFFGCSSLTQVSMPNASILPKRIFAMCSSLQTLDLPEGVGSIDQSAFFCCTNLTSLTLPSTVTNIGMMAFYGTSRLTALNMPPALRTIGEDAFNYPEDERAGKSGLVSFGDNVFPATLEEIGIRAFRDTSLAGLVDLSQTKLTALSEEVFVRTKLTGVLLPPTLTNIGQYAFTGCENLTSIELPDAVTTIDNGAFRSATNLARINIPKKLRTIGSEAFYECDLSQCDDFVFPKCFESFGGTLDAGGKAFIGTKFCAKLDLSRCENLTTIPYGTFARSKYTQLTFPKSLTSVGGYAITDEVDNTRDYVPEIRFCGARPDFRSTGAAGDWKYNFGWRLLIRIPSSDPALTATWTSDSRYKPVSAMTSPEKNLNYETVSQVKGFLGEFDGSWVATWKDKPTGMILLVR